MGMSLKLMALLQLVITDVVFAFLYYAGVDDVDYYILSFAIIYIVVNLVLGHVNRRVRGINTAIMAILVFISLVIIALKVLPLLIKPPTR